MTTMTATELRRELFKVLKRVAAGDIVAIRRNGKEVARLVPVEAEEWRDAIDEKLHLLVSDEEAFEPLDDLWGAYR